MSIINGIASSKICDKRYYVNFEIVNISHFLMEMFLAPLPMVYIFRSLFVLREYVLMLMPLTTDTNFDCLVTKTRLSIA